MLLLEDDVLLFRLKGFLWPLKVWFSDEVAAALEPALALVLALGLGLEVALRGVPPACSIYG